MPRNDFLVEKKYMEYLLSTMGFIVSVYVAAIADGILVSRLIGTEAFAAVNLTMPIYYLRNTVFFLFIDGGATLAAQFVGARRLNEYRQTFTVSIMFGAIAMFVIGVIGCLLADGTAEILAGESSLKNAVYDYLVPLWATGPLLIFSNGVSSYLRLESQHRLAVAVPIVANIFNLLFDYVFIAEFNWGIAGAGWATVAGYAVSLLLIVPYFCKSGGNLKLVKFTHKLTPIFQMCMKIGLPMATIPLCLVLRNYAVNSIAVSEFGDVGAISVSIVNAAMMYALMFADGAGMTVSTVCGALYGEKDFKGTLSVLLLALRSSFVMCLVLFSAILIFADDFAKIYDVAPSILPQTEFYLRISAVHMLFVAPVFIMRAFYQATKQEKAATIFSLLEGVALFVPLLYALSLLNPAAMWTAYSWSSFFALVWLVIRMQKTAARNGSDNILMLRDTPANSDWETSIDATIDAITQAAETVEKFCAERKISGKQACAAQITVEEICLYIVKHGNLREKDKIDIFLHIEGDSLSVKIRDAGIPHDHTKFLDNGDDESLGLIVVSKMTDKIESKIEYAGILGFNNTIVTIKKRQ